MKASILPRGGHLSTQKRDEKDPKEAYYRPQKRREESNMIDTYHLTVLFGQPLAPLKQVRCHCHCRLQRKKSTNRRRGWNHLCLCYYTEPRGCIALNLSFERQNCWQISLIYIFYVLLFAAFFRFQMITYFNLYSYYNSTLIWSYRDHCMQWSILIWLSTQLPL